ncbi:MAG: hypothetical protein KBC48_00090 [Candidatus Pacebacteria bacterium]|nr:hypothetical protein [Candidatus Paceibacterota bacterium]
MATTRSNRKIYRQASPWPLIGAGILVGLLIIIGLVLYLPFFLIEEIEVEGAQIVKSEEVVGEVTSFLAGNKFLIIPRRHIWLYAEEELQAHLFTTFSRLDSVSAVSGFPSKLTITVTERSPVMLYCEGNLNCFFINKQGVAYTRSPSFSPGVFLEWRASSTAITAPLAVSNAAEVERLLDLKTIILQVLELLGLKGWQVNSFTSTADHDFIFTVTPARATSTQVLPWEIMVDQETPALTVGNNLHAALSAILKDSQDKTLPPLQYVDVRFGKKVFYKL